MNRIKIHDKYFEPFIPADQLDEVVQTLANKLNLRLAGKTGDKVLRRQVLAALNSGNAAINANPFWYATPVAARLRAAGIAP